MTWAPRPAGVRASRPVIFRVAAGPRLGFGHLVRATRLAGALGVRPLVSCRGRAHARGVAESLGCQLVDGPPSSVLAARRPGLVIVDDPSGRHAARWCAAAKRAGTPVASIHDRGIGACDSDLLIDGSVTRNGHLRRRATALLGPRYAVIEPRCASAARGERHEAATPSVLIALGGGSRARACHVVAAALQQLRPDLRLRIASGFGDGPAGRTRGGVTWLPPLPSLFEELAMCTIAIVGGGVTAYEGCALGVPMVAVAAVAAQRPTIRALAAAGALLDGGRLFGESACHRARACAIATQAIRLLGSAPMRSRLALAGRSLVDGRGAQRVAIKLLDLLGDVDRRAA